MITFSFATSFAAWANLINFVERMQLYDSTTDEFFGLFKLEATLDCWKQQQIWFKLNDSLVYALERNESTPFMWLFHALLVVFVYVKDMSLLTKQCSRNNTHNKQLNKQPTGNIHRTQTQRTDWLV